jgi:hypothetical protein
MPRLSLPLHPRTDERPPTAGDVRKRLGGTGQSESGAGVVVRFVDEPGAGTLGVVLFRGGDEVDVYLGEGWLRRTTAGAVASLDVAPPDSLAAIATDARVFFALRNGDRVRYQDSAGQVLTGVLVEKCRYGALVVNERQRLVGVGFRKLWPLPAAGSLT